MLEIEFLGEEGTALGPTLELYALVSAELQKKSLALWLCEDAVADDLSRQVDIVDGVKPAGFYVQRSCGLFPAPRLQNNSDALTNIESLFSFIGIFFAKCNHPWAAGTVLKRIAEIKGVPLPIIRKICESSFRRLIDFYIILEVDVFGRCIGSKY